MTEMKDLGKELFFFAGLERGTDEDFRLSLTSPSVTPSPTSLRGEKWDLNEDRPEGGPAGPKSPGRGDCFSSGTGWPGGKGYTEGGGKGDQHAPAAGSAVFFLPAVRSRPSLQAAPPPLPVSDSLLGSKANYGGETIPSALLSPAPLSWSSCNFAGRDRLGFTSLLPQRSCVVMDKLITSLVLGFSICEMGIVTSASQEL